MQSTYSTAEYIFNCSLLYVEWCDQYYVCFPACGECSGQVLELNGSETELKSCLTLPNSTSPVCLDPRRHWRDCQGEGEDICGFYMSCRDQLLTKRKVTFLTYSGWLTSLKQAYIGEKCKGFFSNPSAFNASVRLSPSPVRVARLGRPRPRRVRGVCGV
jgi:hypothetical protein